MSRELGRGERVEEQRERHEDRKRVKHLRGEKSREKERRGEDVGDDSRKAEMIRNWKVSKESKRGE